MTMPLPLKYPHIPGAQIPKTSRDAGASIQSHAHTVRQKVLQRLIDRPLTADECAQTLDESILTVRPRLSELRKMGLIKDSGIRRTNDSGKSAIVWTTRPQEA
jgi:predicted Rossmann fold nucleotide-binding protein DprA/Smf involved in DNA uptake